jgi:DNA-binding protein HU-beta
MEETSMNKADLINDVAKSTGTKAEAEKAVNAILETIKKALAKGDKVTLIGFGTFSVVKRSARKVRSPQTGKEITIKAKNVPKFTAGKKLKEIVAEKDKTRIKAGCWSNGGSYDC